MSNLDFWNSVEKSHSSQLRRVQKGSFSFMAIDAYSQIKNATEKWGMFGKEWGVRDSIFTQIGDNILYQAILYYPDGELPIESDVELIFRSGKRAGNYNLDFSKKVSTDALTKGLSKLGFNADVFLGLWDDNKYVQETKKDEAQEIRDTATKAKQESGVKMRTDDQVVVLEEYYATFKEMKKYNEYAYIEGQINRTDMTFDETEALIYKIGAKLDGLSAQKETAKA